MEALFGLIVIIFLVARFTRKSGVKKRYHDKRNERNDPKRQTRVPVVRNKSSGARPAKQIVRFDEKTAKPDISGQVLSGRAFIIDGDSLVINKTQIRLFGVDAPELNHPFGIKAKWALVSLCKGQTVCAEITAIDVHGRTVAKCSLPDGSDLSAEMVKQGLAIDWPKFSDGVYRSLEVPDARRKMWLADARQKGRMHVWEQFDYDQMRKKNSE